MAERIVVVQGDGPEWLIDLEKNPGIEERIESGELRIVKQLKALPPDPWAKKAAKAAEGEPAGEKPLEKMNHDELAVVVEAEQVDLGDASTKKEIAAKIAEARAAKAEAEAKADESGGAGEGEQLPEDPAQNASSEKSE
jgi:hypothetical protein